jgi:hypothetical protein
MGARNMYANMPDLEEASSGSEDEVFDVEAAEYMSLIIDGADMLAHELPQISTITHPAGHTSEDIDRMWWAFGIQRNYCEAFVSAIRLEPQISTITHPAGHTSEDIDRIFRQHLSLSLSLSLGISYSDACIFEAAKYYEVFASAIPRQVYLKVPPFVKLLLPDTLQSKSRFLYGCLAHLIKTGVFRWIYIDFRRPCDRFFSVCVWLDGKVEGAHKKHGPQRK